MRFQKIALLASFLGLVFTSCTLYEDGPIFSVLSKKQRVANVWVAERVTDSNGNDVTGSYDSWTWTFTEDGEATVSYKLVIDIVINGTWNLLDNGAIFQLITNELLGQNIAEYDILRLTDDEFWVRADDNTVFRLKAK